MFISILGAQITLFMETSRHEWVSLKVVVWIYYTFDNNFEIENDFANYLKESCW